MNLLLRSWALFGAFVAAACGPGGPGGPDGPGGNGGIQGEWRPISVTAPDGYDFVDIAGSSRDDVWIVGRGVFHWDGNVFREDARWTNTAVRLVVVAGPNDVYVVPSASKELHHFDGSTWTKVATLVDPNPIYDIFLAGSQLWARSYDKLYRLDGAAFTHVPFSSRVERAAALGPDDIWISNDRTVHRWSGGQWSQVFTATRTVIELRPFGANDVWARIKETGVARAGHWDGTSFKEFDPGLDMGMASPTELRAMWGNASNDVWFSRPYYEGAYVDPAPATEFIHWNGSEFSKFLVNETFSAEAAWGSGPGDVWFVGGPKKVFRFGP